MRREFAGARPVGKTGKLSGGKESVGPEVAMSWLVRGTGAALSPLDEAERALAQRLHQHVDMLAELIGPRHMDRPAALEATTAYIRRTLEASGYAVASQRYDVSGRPAENLIAELPGIDRPEDIVVLGAHVDTVPETPGADDNASAVAGLLEAARLLAGRRCRRTVRFIAFANEEPPHFYTQTMGSEHYARACRQARENIVGMVCLEMIGYFDPRAGSQDYPEGIPWPLRRLLPARGDFIAMVSNLRSIRLLHAAKKGFRRAVRFPLLAVPLPERIHEIRLSDHGSFWDHGYPALMVTDTSFFRNPHYHQATDRAATLDYERLARVTIGVAGAIEQIAGRSARGPAAPWKRRD